MDRNSFLTKVFTSTLGLAILYGLPFGLILGTMNNDGNGLVNGILFGLLFGIPMALFTKKTNIERFEFAKSVQVKKSKKMEKYLKSGTVPQSESEIRELETYMTKQKFRINEVNDKYYPHSYSKPVLYAFILTLGIVTLLLWEPWWLSLVFFGTLITGLIGEINNKVMLKRIERVRLRLDDQN